MNIENNLQDLKKKFNDIERNLESPTNLSQKEFITLSKEYSELRPIIKIIDEYNTLKEEISNLEEIMKDENSEGDIKELAKEEFFEKHKVLLPKVKAKLKLALLPKVNNALPDVIPARDAQLYEHCNLQVVSFQCLTLESSFLIISSKMLYSAQSILLDPSVKHWDDTFILEVKPAITFNTLSSKTNVCTIVHVTLESRKKEPVSATWVNKSSLSLKFEAITINF